MNSGVSSYDCPYLTLVPRTSSEHRPRRRRRYLLTNLSGRALTIRSVSLLFSEYEKQIAKTYSASSLRPPHPVFLFFPLTHYTHIFHAQLAHAPSHFNYSSCPASLLTSTHLSSLASSPILAPPLGPAVAFPYCLSEPDLRLDPCFFFVRPAPLRARDTAFNISIRSALVLLVLPSYFSVHPLSVPKNVFRAHARSNSCFTFISARYNARSAPRHACPRTRLLGIFDPKPLQPTRCLDEPLFDIARDRPWHLERPSVNVKTTACFFSPSQSTQQTRSVT